MKNLKKFTEFGVLAMLLSMALLTACGGGGSSTATSGFIQSYTTSAGVGEILQFGINTINSSYTYTVAKTSYAASGVTAGQSGSGALSSNLDGTFTVGPSSDGFILSGRVRPIRNALFAGHVVISRIGGIGRIPVFGLSNPITTIAGLADTYNYQGFSCSVKGIADATGNGLCASHYGTGTVDTAGAYTICKGGDISNQGTNPCTTTSTGTLQVIPSLPGVFDYRNASGHIGWFFAFTAANGQKIAVIDHDDAISTTNEFGNAVFTSYASAVAGTVDGRYFVKNNEGGEHLVTVSGTSVASTLYPGVAGTLTYNAPWSGLVTYNFPASAVSGVAMIAGSGAYTHISNVDPALFAVGLKY